MNEDAGFDWPLAIFLICMFIAIGTTIAVIVWQAMSTWRAKMAVSRDQAYRALADSTAQQLERVVAQLEKTNAELAQLRTHTAELERMLRDV